MFYSCINNISSTQWTPVAIDYHIAHVDTEYCIIPEGSTGALYRDSESITEPSTQGHRQRHIHVDDLSSVKNCMLWAWLLSRHL